MIVCEIYKGSGLGNQLWNLVVTKILAEKHKYSWGVIDFSSFFSSLIRIFENLSFF